MHRRGYPARRKPVSRVDGGGGIAVYHIYHAFGVAQIHLAVQKRAAREFAPVGYPRARGANAFQHMPEQGGSAVAVQFRHVLARVRVGRGKKYGKRFVAHAAAIQFAQIHHIRGRF